VKKSLRIGLIGCGQIAQVHAKFVLADGRHRIVAVCDEDRTRAAAFAQRFGIANTYGSLSELLAEQRPDVVHVVTPPQSHACLAIEAMRAGSHVLVEKPMAMSVSEADAMIAASRDHGVKLCVNHNQLFDPVVAQARRMVADGTVGRVISVEAYYGFNVAQTGERRWVDTLPGNVFQNVAPHPISLILPFIEDPIEVNVSTLATGTLGPDVSDELRVLLAGSAGMGVLSISLAIRPHVNFLKIYGSKGIIHVDLANMILSLERLRPLPKAVARGLMSVEQGVQLAGGAVRNALKLLSGRLKPYQGLGNLIAAFHASLEESGDPPVSGEDGRRVVRVWKDIHSKLSVPAASGQRASRPRTGRPTVAVTGASGFLGSHLIERLSQQGIAARAIVRPTSRIDHLRRLNVEWVTANLTDADALKRSLDGCDTVYHCAAATKGTWNDYVEGTICATDRLLEASHAVGVSRFVHISSLSVYGVSHFTDGSLVTEDTPYEPHPELRGFYSHSKVEAEKRALAFGSERGLPIVVLRPGTMYGPRGKVFFPRVGYSLKNKVFVIIGRGESLLPLAYVENVVDAICLAAARDDLRGRCFNIVDDEEITQGAYLQHLIEQTGLRAVTLHAPFVAVEMAALAAEMSAWVRGHKGPRSARYRLRSATKDLRFDNTRAKTELRWTPNVSLGEGLRRTFEWHNREHGRSRVVQPATVATAADPS
jgi:predicted dehydrogenase/nucleoside-diphosphate-sugar epimerase